MPPSSLRQSAYAANQKPAVQPFLGLINAVTVADPEFKLDGAVAQSDVAAVWTWVVRDLGADLIDIEAVADDATSRAALESLMPELLTRARAALAEASTNPATARRISTQLGGERYFPQLPGVLTALRNRALVAKAEAFGRAANGMADDAQLALALQAMPLGEANVAPSLMMAVVGQVANPTRLITCAIRIANGATEAALERANFRPMIDAMFAHAQNQLPALLQQGMFGDMDLICRSVDRFHRLVRAVTGYVELSRGSRWSTVAAALTKTASDRIEPKLRDIGRDLNMALRRREGADRVDGDQILLALNGVYLLATVRDSRDSLAVNALFEQVWVQVGQALESHIERNLDYLRRDPADRNASARLDAALKMAEIRFNQEYADTIRRAKETTERRA